jgi:hypothetical protein
MAVDRAKRGNMREGISCEHEKWENGVVNVLATHKFLWRSGVGRRCYGLVNASCARSPYNAPSDRCSLEWRLPVKTCPSGKIWTKENVYEKRKGEKRRGDKERKANERRMEKVEGERKGKDGCEKGREHNRKNAIDGGSTWRRLRDGGTN